MEPGPAEQEIIQQQDTQSAAVTSSRPTEPASLQQGRLGYAEQEQTKTQKKQYIRKFTDEGRAKQKQHLDEIRKKAMEKKKEMREITLKAKLMKLEPKLNLAKKYDEYITSKLINTRCAAVTESRPEPEPEPDTHSAAVTSSRPEPEPEPEVKIIKKPKQKKIIYKEISDDEDEEEIVYIKKPTCPRHCSATREPKQETYDRTLYKSATEQLHMRAVEERIRNNLLKWRHALEPVEY
jgi:hypothetical protein